MVWRRGNPRTSETVQNALHSAKATCSSHVVKGSYALLPQKVRAIRDNLLSRGKSEDLQLLCITLISIYLFLRHDECHKIKVEDFRPEYSSVEKHRVNHLCVQIIGKTNNVPKNMILWSYDDCRDLCPVRHFLSYVHLCGIKDGFLLPNFSETLNYASVMDTIINRFKHILNHDAKLTTHSFRKTGYLFAMWEGMDLQQAKVAARHSLDTMAQR
jgi:integrase